MTSDISLVNILFTFVMTILSGFIINRLESLYLEKNKDKIQPKELSKEERVKGYFFFALGYVFLGIILIWLLEFKWPLTNFQSFLLFLGYFVLSLFIFVLKGIIQHKSGISHSRIEAIPIIILLITIFFLNKFMDHDISIDIPSKVDGKTIISGRVVDSDWHVYVLIKPIQSSGTFLTKSIATDGDKNWSAVCDFGGSSGSVYCVRAVALPSYVFKIIGDSPSVEKIDEIAPFRSRMVMVKKE
jgi:hypothetical protein